MATPLSSKLEWAIANNLWAQSLNPVLANPLNNVQILSNITLVSGANTISHKLGRQMQGWFLVDLQASVSVYRSEPFNPNTLILTASGPATCSIGVF